MSERPEDPARAPSEMAEQLRAVEAMIAEVRAEEGEESRGVQMLLERVRELIDAVNQFEASLDAQRGQQGADPPAIPDDEPDAGEPPRTNSEDRQ